MAQNNILRPSFFKLAVYIWRGTLAICRHLLKHRASYCVLRKEKPTLYGRRRYDYYKAFPQASLEYCNLSREPYLRPTRYCNVHAPEVVALAYNLRNSCNSDWDYAYSIFDFICNEIIFVGVAPPPHGVIDTLERGYGTCLDKLNLLVALARAGGIPARYCTVDSRFIAIGPPNTVGRKVNLYDWLFVEVMGFKVKTQERRDLAVLMYLITEAQHFFGRRVHPHAELKIGGLWIPVDPTLDNNLAAGLNLPLQRFGYDPLMLWGHAGDGITRTEGMPGRPRQWLRRRLFCAFTCGKDNCLNLAIQEVRARGTQVLAKVGESEYMRSKRSYYVPVKGISELGVSLSL